MLIFYVTSRCNADCDFCYYKNRLKKEKDLNIGEIRKMSLSIGPLFSLLITGGEPFLRKDLVEICNVFIKNNGVNNITITTNGMSIDKTISGVEELLQYDKRLKLTITVELDGPGKYNDWARKRKRSFILALACLKDLVSLKGKFENLIVNVNTVVSDKNMIMIKRLVKILKQEVDIDGHYFEVGKNVKKNDKKVLTKIAEKLAVKNNEYYFPKKYGFVAFNYFMKKTKYYWKIQKDVLNGGQLPFTCLAGIVVGVLESDGDVRFCDDGPLLGNIRNVDYDFMKIWNSAKAERLRRSIMEKSCACVRGNYLYATMQHSPRVSFLDIPLQRRII